MVSFLGSKIDRRKVIILILQVIVITVILNHNLSKSQDEVSRRTTSADSNDGRPIMHTFFQKVNSGENDLLVAWEDEWTRAGFETKILNLGDAKRHPYFKEMEKVVEPIFGKGYNAMCLYRWLAMGSSGGGWMSDYDTFPTNFPMNERKNLPNNGKLTSFEVEVPSLVSGTAEEWTRVAKLLVEAMPKVKKVIKSDMHAFKVIRDEGYHKVYFMPAKRYMREGFPYLKAITPDSPREVDCKMMAGGRAVHFAHYYTRQSFDRGMFPLYNITSVNEANRRRGEAARIFMADWRDQCGGSTASER